MAMVEKFSIPDEYTIPFRRILPYLSASLRNEPKVLESLLLYFKLGGEKMARIVVDALNVTQRIQYAAMIKKMREEAMLRDNRRDEKNEEDEEDEEDKEESDEGEDGNTDQDGDGDAP